jgi:hypothetical protein
MGPSHDPDIRRERIFTLLFLGELLNMTGVSRLTGTLEPAASTVVDSLPKAVPKTLPPKRSLDEFTGLSSLRETSIPTRRAANRVGSVALPRSAPGIRFKSGPEASPAPFVASSGTSAIGSQLFEADSSKGDDIEEQAAPFAATADRQMAMQLQAAKIDMQKKFSEALREIGINGTKNAADAVKR